MADALFKSIGPIDELPLFQVVKEACKALPGKCAAIAVGAGNLVMDGATMMADSIKIASIGAVAFGSMLGKDSPSLEIARAPAKEMDTPAVSRASQHEANICDLGTLTPSALPSCSRGGTGIGM